MYKNTKLPLQQSHFSSGIKQKFGTLPCLRARTVWRLQCAGDPGTAEATLQTSVHNDLRQQETTRDHKGLLEIFGRMEIKPCRCIWWFSWELSPIGSSIWTLGGTVWRGYGEAQFGWRKYATGNTWEFKALTTSSSHLVLSKRCDLLAWSSCHHVYNWAGSRLA